MRPTELAGLLPTAIMVLKATAILVAALLLTLALQRSSASARHQVWLVALAGLLLLPVIATWAPFGIKVLPAGVAATPAAATGAASTVQLPPSDGAVDQVVPEPSEPVTGVPRAGDGLGALPSGLILLGVWGLVALVLIGRLLAGVLAVRRIVHTARPLDDEAWRATLYEVADRLGLDEAPALLRSDRIAMPFAAGFRRALIVLPADADRWSTERREAVLIHELGHVRRHDMIGHLLGRIACAVYWFHPLVWTAARRLRDASERACDDLALRLGAVPSDYAQHLLDIVTTVRQPHTPTAAIAMARRKEFEGRMLAILDPALHRGEPSRARQALLSTCLAGFVIAVSAAAPAPREALTPPAESPFTTMQSTDSVTDSILGHSAPLRTDRREVTELPTSTPEPAAAADPMAAVQRALREQGITTSRVLSDHAVPADEKMDLLIRVLRTDSSGSVRRVAAWGLMHYANDPAAQTQLALALANDADPRVRQMAAWALAHSHAEPALAALRRALAADSDMQVRETAVWGLGSHGDSQSRDAIAALLDGESSELVRGTAAWALGQMDVKEAPPALVALLQSTNRDTRLKAAWALSEIGDHAAVPAIKAALEAQQDEATTRALLRALVKSGATPEELTSYLSSANPDIRLHAIKAISGGNTGLDPWPWPWPRPIPMP